MFFQIGIFPDFAWIFIDWVSAGFFPGVCSPTPKKKNTGKKFTQKMFPQIQSKISIQVVFQEEIESV